MFTDPPFQGTWHPDGSQPGGKGNQVAICRAVIQMCCEHLPMRRHYARQRTRHHHCKYAECCEGAWEAGCPAGESAGWEVGAVAVMSKVWGEEMGVWEALWSLRFLEMEAFC